MASVLGVFLIADRAFVLFIFPQGEDAGIHVSEVSVCARGRFCPAKLSWGPDIRLAAALLSPVALPHIAQQFSLDEIQYILEALILLLGLTVFGIAALKPLFLGSPAYRLAPEGR